MRSPPGYTRSRYADTLVAEERELTQGASGRLRCDRRLAWNGLALSLIGTLSPASHIFF